VPSFSSIVGWKWKNSTSFAVQGWVAVAHPNQVGHRGGGLAVSVVTAAAPVHGVRHRQLPVLVICVVDAANSSPASSMGIAAVVIRSAYPLRTRSSA
jgi:hypothetical protein